MDLPARRLSAAGGTAAVARRSAAAAPVLVALALWAVSLSGAVDLDGMTDLGLISVLPVAFYAALAVLTAGFVAALRAPRLREAVLGAHALALIAVVHATPAILYGTLRYSWSWKHVGIVDYIQRHGGVDPHYYFLQAYHDWPGFFSLGALAVEAMGEDTAVRVAAWAPPFFNLLFLGAVLFVAGSLTRDRRIVWGAAWLFLLGNWVGQDYFAPQALCYVLYLVILGIVLRWFPLRRATVPAPPAGWPRSPRALARALRAVLRPALPSRPPAPAPGSRAALLVLSLLFSAVIVTSHQLTPFLLIVALVALSALRLARAAWLAAAVAAMTGAWIATAARPFLDNNWYWIADSIGSPGGNASSTLINLGQASSGMALVARADRALTAAVIVLAAVGVWRRFRRGRVDLAAIVLAAAPGVALMGNSYGGEMVFRVYFFALPFLAVLGAHALPLGAPRVPGRRATAVVAAAGALLLAGFCVSYYGKERMHRFSPDEVAASRWLYRTAPPGSLLVSGTFNYPWAFSGYERYQYEALSKTPAATRRRLVAAPERTIAGLLRDHDGKGEYVIVGAGQRAEVDMTGVLPRGTLQRVERALRASPDFELVFARPDVNVFELRERP